MGDHCISLRLGVKRAVVRWSRVAYADGGANYIRGSLAVSAGALEIAIVIQGALVTLLFNLLYKITQQTKTHKFNKCNIA